MIISHEHRFIFIKTLKTAGTSIETYLSPVCGADDVLTPFGVEERGHESRNSHGLFNPFPEILATRGEGIRKTLHDLKAGARYYNHIPAYLVKSRVGARIWNAYYKFTVDRNPWDKALSYYYFFSKRFASALTLDQYLQDGPRALNYLLYTDYRDPDRIIVDRVIRYETLNSELGEVFDSLGIPFDGSLGIRAKGSYRSDRRPYQSVLNSRQKQKIADIYQQEIKLLGYSY